MTGDREPDHSKCGPETASQVSETIPAAIYQDSHRAPVGVLKLEKHWFREVS